jgi:capsular exopolysaccharide synthesis family protein
LPPSPNGNGHEANYRLTMMVPKRRYLSYLRERWWVVLICLVVAVSAMLIYETVRATRYTSYAQIYMSGNVQLGMGSLFSEESFTYYGTQIELLKSARLQSAAFEKAGITFAPGQKNTYKIDVIQPMKTSILQLQATGPDPELTQRFLQKLLSEYLAYKKETRLKTSEDVLDSIQDELTRKAADLQAEQDKLAEFQKSNNVAVLEEEGKSAGLYLSELNLALAKARLEQNLLNEGQTNGTAGIFTLDATNPIPSSTFPATTNLVASSDDDAFNSVRLSLAVLLGNREDKIRAMGVYGFEKEVERLQRLIVIMLDDKRTHLQERVAAIQAALPVWETKVLDINDRLSQGQRLKNNVAREQGYYDHMLGMLENVDLGKNVQQEQLSVLQAPTAAQPELRSLPSRIVLAALGGLMFSLGIIFVWYLLDDRFVSFRDIKDQFGETFLGLVPQIKVPRANPQSALLASNDGRPAYVESYRHLRSALLLSAVGESRPQLLLFTSASRAEGKTTIAINLARLLARSGLRVVLVDADGQGGGMRRLLGDQEQPGMLDYLRGEASAKAIVYPTEFDTLLLVPAGTHKEHSEGLFLRPKLADLIQELRQNADFVILDGAPILASDAAALLVPHADTVILVTRPFYTRSRLVRQALDMLYQRQAKHVSIILNCARADDLAGHYAMNGFANPTVENGKT